MNDKGNMKKKQIANPKFEIPHYSSIFYKKSDIVES